jgi:hypothetical protein
MKKLLIGIAIAFVVIAALWVILAILMMPQARHIMSM